MGSYCACALPGPCQRSRSLAQTKRIVGSGDENEERQVSKTAEHARAVPAINVTKWRTTNKVLPRSFASRQSARGELLVKNMGSVKRTTLLVCLGVSSEKSVVIIHMIIPFILLLLVKMFATTRKRSGLSFSCLLRSAVAG